jgi:hypothetical protein
MKPSERRQLRSEIPYQAAQLYLACLKGRHLLHAAAVSDRTGLPLVGIGTPSELEVLALWGALTLAEQERYQSTLDDICHSAAGVSWNRALGDENLTVSGVASSRDCVTMIERDLTRILAPLRARIAV